MKHFRNYSAARNHYAKLLDNWRCSGYRAELDRLMCERRKEWSLGPPKAEPGMTNVCDKSGRYHQVPIEEADEFDEKQFGPSFRLKLYVLVDKEWRFYRQHKGKLIMRFTTRARALRHMRHNIKWSEHTKWKVVYPDGREEEIDHGRKTEK